MLQRNVTASGALHRLTRAFPFLSVLGGHLKILPSLYTRETRVLFEYACAAAFSSLFICIFAIDNYSLLMMQISVSSLESPNVSSMKFIIITIIIVINNMTS